VNPIRFLRLTACLACLACFAVAAWSPRAIAADAPTEATGPKAAMKSFYQALEAGDVPALRASFATTSDAERQLADAFVDEVTAAKALGEAAKAKFSATGDALTRGIPAHDQIAALDKADVAIDGDAATLKLPGQVKPIRLVKSDGRWRIAIDDFAGVTPEKIPVQTGVLKDMAGAFNSVAADINADKFPSAQDAQRALQQKLQVILFDALKKNPPTTAPARTTKP